jgi:carboxyl-terminal processing protease
MRCFVYLVFLFGHSATLQAATFPQGVWQNQDYGYVLDTSGPKAQLFDLNDLGCVLNKPLSAQELAGYFGNQVEVVGDQLIARAGIGEYRFRRQQRLPKNCEKKYRLDGSNPQLNFHVLLTTLKKFEINAEQRGLDWSALEQEFSPRVKAAKNSKMLWQLMVDLVKRTNDPHVSISNGRDEESAISERERLFEKQHGADSISVRKGLKTYLQSAASPIQGELSVVGNRKIAWGRLADNDCYVAPLAMGGYVANLPEDAGADAHAKAAEPVFDELFTQLKTCRALIIDLRFNQGGFDSVSLAWAARVATTQTLAFRKSIGTAAAVDVGVKPNKGVRFAGPVAVLIGHYTVSAGETCAQAMKQLSNVITIGDPTQGAFSDAIPKTLPNGWTFTLSMERYESPDGSKLELHGVMPKYASGLTLRKNDEDRYGAEIKQAIRLLNTQ